MARDTPTKLTGIQTNFSGKDYWERHNNRYYNRAWHIHYFAICYTKPDRRNLWYSWHSSVLFIVLFKKCSFINLEVLKDCHVQVMSEVKTILTQLNPISLCTYITILVVAEVKSLCNTLKRLLFVSWSNYHHVIGECFNTTNFHF